jgi:hypothetical protein
MKKRPIFKIVMMLFACQVLTSCFEKKTNQGNYNKEVTNLTNHNVGLASGVSFKPGAPLENNEFVVINPFNGKIVKPCGRTIIAEKSTSTTEIPHKAEKYTATTEIPHKSDKPCNNEIVEATPELQNALELNKLIMKGFISIDGVKTEAVFFVSVTALYKGSHCTTLHLTGAAYTNCVNAENEDPF